MDMLHTLTYAFLAYAALVFLLNLWYFRRRQPPQPPGGEDLRARAGPQRGQPGPAA
jgi:hypothetical protein